MPTSESENSAIIFDRNAVRRHQARAAASFAEHDFLFREVAERLADRLQDIKRSFDVGISLGARGDHLRESLMGNDAISVLHEMGSNTGSPGIAFIGDEEALPVKPNSADLIVSNLALHWTNDVPGTLIQCRQALKPDGLFMAAILGGETLTELRQVLMEVEAEISGGVSPRISPFAELSDAASLLQRAGFNLPVADSDTITVTYSNVFALMHDLRGMGETNAVVTRPKYFSKRQIFLRAAERYSELFAGSDGKIPASFQVLYLTGWAPDASQQKPLRPGTASTRLADALETEEHSAGETADPENSN
ncbi:MAG: SAM-dependent methyltransferase [Rhodospirillaceae bacterium]|nr:SAM-dependent methyltransferase [Rhodospirillaceae bacterium]|tara:strand:+ start:37367 stop:38287 length:921 start_codon:yes stop_codon:yes gene_type:complete